MTWHLKSIFMDRTAIFLFSSNQWLSTIPPFLISLLGLNFSGIVYSVGSCAHTHLHLSPTQWCIIYPFTTSLPPPHLTLPPIQLT